MEERKQLLDVSEVWKMGSTSTMSHSDSFSFASVIVVVEASEARHYSRPIRAHATKPQLCVVVAFSELPVTESGATRQISQVVFKDAITSIRIPVSGDTVPFDTLPLELYRQRWSVHSI